GVRRGDLPGTGRPALNAVPGGRPGRAALPASAARLPVLAWAARADASAATFVHGKAVPGTADPALARPAAQRLSVVTAADPRSNAAKDLVQTVRARPGPAGAGAYAGGQTAEPIDTTHATGTRLPLAAP